GKHQHFYCSPDLEIDGEPTIVARWLQEADMQYADIVQGPGKVDAQLGEGISPMKGALDLLENDDKYRKLTRDLVMKPIDWPNLELDVVDLAADEPLQWKTDFQIQFIGPDGVRAVPNSGDSAIEPWMVTQAMRPYAKLREGIQGADGELRDKLIRSYP